MCGKCGASFDDEGDMAEHAQNCRGTKFEESIKEIRVAPPFYFFLL